MKADRLLAILLRLDTEQRITAGELAAELEVSPRTIIRDLEALSAAGIPVVAERGKGGGWFLLRPYRTDLSGLSAAEASSLFLPLAPAYLGALGWNQNAASGRTKLRAMFSEEVQQHITFMHARILVDTPGWQLDEQVQEQFSFLQTALWEGQQIRFVYWRMTGERQNQELDPYGLVFRSGRWSVLGVKDGVMRAFRIDRIEDLEVTGQPSERPDDFDLKSAWTQVYNDMLASLPVYPFTVQLAESDLPALTFNVRFCKVDWQRPAPDLSPQMWRAGLIADTPDAALAFVMSLADRIWVEQPLELRQRMLEAAQTLLSRSQGEKEEGTILTDGQCPE